MALATLDDITALGGIRGDASLTAAETERANRLLALASGLVLAYLDQFGVSETDVEEWEEFRRTALAAIVAEVAVKRLNVAAAPNVDPYFAGAAGTQTIKLNRWEQDAISDLLPGGGVNAATSVIVERDFSWLTGVEDVG